MIINRIECNCIVMSVFFIIVTKGVVTDYSKPTLSLMEDFRGINILEQIGTMYFRFGTLILNEEKGDIVTNIQHDCTNNVECINQQIIRKWLQGGERYHKPTWDELVSVLCTIRLNVLAETIMVELAKSGIYITMSNNCKGLT